GRVLLAIGDVQVAVGVDEADVARLQPPVLDGRLRGDLVAEVALHDVVAADDELAGLTGRHVVAVVVDDTHVDAGERLADGGGDHLGGVGVTAHADRARRVVYAVAG